MKVLLKLNLIRQEQLTNGIIYNDYLPIAYFAHSGCFDEWEAIERVAKDLHIKTFRMTPEERRQAHALLDGDPFSKISVAEWNKIRAVPVFDTQEAVTLVMANPLDIETIRRLEFALHRKIIVAIGAEKSILTAIGDKRDSREGIDVGALIEETKTLEVKNSSHRPAALESNIVSEDIAAPTVIKLVNKIFSESIRQRASDIHISCQVESLVVRFRVDGIMRDFVEVPGALRNAVISRVKVLCGMDIAERRQPQDGRLRLKTAGGDRDLRVSTVPTAFGEDIVARILVSELSEVSFASLGIPSTIQQQLKRALSASSKVIVAAGPTGSGKTSTLYASLIHERDGTTSIVTVEDPIEYRIAGVSQIQVNSKIGMTFGSALRSILRQDPDVILVGEVRDSETAEIAMRSAQTGHLVLTSLHANSAPAAVTRLRDLGVPSYLIASSLGCIVAQRLVRRLCTHCCAPLSEHQAERARELGIPELEKLREAKGCPECMQTGYSGRVGVYSFFDVAPDVAQAIRDEASEPELEKIARKRGFLPLAEAALLLVRDGTTSLEEVERVMGLLDSPGIMPLVTEGSPTIGIQNTEETNGIIPKRRVLLVDDDENTRAVFQTMLEYAMFDVVQANDGVEALEMIYKGPPELVVCDLLMPRMGGLQFVDKLRSDMRTRGIPVLMLTAAATESNELELIQRGADDFVSKTAKPELIVARINRLMNRSHDV